VLLGYYSVSEAHAVGLGTFYHDIIDLIGDRERIEQFADAADISRRNICNDTGQWTIKGTRGHVQTWGDPASYLLYLIAYSSRIWGAIKRKARTFDWQLTQDGEREGCFRLGLPDQTQSNYLRHLLGLRRRRKGQPSFTEILDKEGVSAS